MRKIIAAIMLLIPLSAFGVDDVRILPLQGPAGTAKISPANGSATAYLMTFSGQKSICFKNASTTDSYISTATTVGLNGYPLYNKGETICADLAGGTTLYFYGDGAGADIRAFMVR